jgi:uncharacterized OB-fold protein
MTDASQNQKPLLDEIFELSGADGQPHLLVSHCPHCGAFAFPARERCARCSARDLPREPAPGRGTLYTWTVIRELGKLREGFVPYVIGQVDLAKGLRVMGIVKAAPETLSVGMPVRTALIGQGRDEDGTERVGYAFEPARE